MLVILSSQVLNSNREVIQYQTRIISSQLYLDKESHPPFVNIVSLLFYYILHQNIRVENIVVLVMVCNLSDLTFLAHI